MRFWALFLPPFALALAVSFLVTPVVIWLSKRMGIVDDPSKHHHPKVVHTYPVPRGGGLPIFVALVLGSYFFLSSDIRIWGILAGAALTIVVGVIDDRWDINPYLRIVTNLLAAVPLLLVGISLSFVTNPFGGIINFSPVVAVALTLLWVGGMMNFLGQGAGGVDGQHAGVVTVAAVMLAILSARYITDPGQWPVLMLAAIVGGAHLGFLPWNFYPQKIMPGYSGKSLAGFLLAVVAILAVAKVQTLLMILAVPLADAGWSAVRRVLSGKSPVWGDNLHLHHRLLASGWGKRRVAVFYWMITAISGVLALGLNSKQKFYTLVAAFLIIGTVILWLSFWTSSGRSDLGNGSRT